MKCRKCEAEIPYNPGAMGVRSSPKTYLCPACLAVPGASGNSGEMGCLYVLLGIIAFFGLMVFLWINLSFWLFILSWLAICIAIAIWVSGIDSKKLSYLNPEERKEFDRSQLLGPIRPQIVCTHCQTKGMVRTKGIGKDAGISGKKASAAALTGGISILATGLSRKERVTQAHCDYCGSKWTF
jgi:hypothetical protein